MRPSELLDTFRPIGLEELNAAAGLLDRVDCKYIVSMEAFGQMGYAADLHGSLSPEALAFVRDNLRTAYGRELAEPLAPSVHMSYRRTTLAAPELGERVTCDDTLRFYDPSGRYGAQLQDDFVIVESKSARGDALADRILRELGARPLRNCSKYCMGIALLRPEINANRQLPLMRRYFAAAEQLRPAGASIAFAQA